ncbi:hypothetical protein L1987_61584 [Smallanthus sonchifolius]|uniref:Uncharacterized protein n=1 Tax=Smallanthus sonchifolius TaxID=185202 RepID=A0ACB9C801_9ASTR|nr:hypothetical protein L1987_61584 [Smallanthus sonchifolius]
MMEEPQKVIDVMNNLQIHCNHFLRRQSDDDRITQQWQDTIDPLKLVLGKVIGRGAFSVVHKGSYHGQTVAVKVVDFGQKGVTKASILEAMKIDFMKEVRLWQNLHHPNVTKMIGATMSMKTDSAHKNKKSKTESNFCIVSEYLKGGSLRSYLFKNRYKKLPMKMVYQFALDIAKGFGICLWEIYCCEMAYMYDLDNITPDIYEIMRPSIPMNCPRSLAQIIERCWGTDPMKRPEMKDVVVELEETMKLEGWQTLSEDHNTIYGCFGFFSHAR